VIAYSSSCREARSTPATVPRSSLRANAAPEVLARKLALLPDREMPVLRAEDEDIDVVYSAHVIAHPDTEQMGLLTVSEPSYELRRLKSIRCKTELGEELTEIEALGALCTIRSSSPRAASRSSFSAAAGSFKNPSVFAFYFFE
jgi:hypothetical protein